MDSLVQQKIANNASACFVGFSSQFILYCLFTLQTRCGATTALGILRLNCLALPLISLLLKSAKGNRRKMLFPRALQFCHRDL